MLGGGRTYGVAEGAPPDGGAQARRVGPPLAGHQAVLGRPDAERVRALRVQQLQKVAGGGCGIKLQVVEVVTVGCDGAHAERASSNQEPPLHSTSLGCVSSIGHVACKSAHSARQLTSAVSSCCIPQCRLGITRTRTGEERSRQRKERTAYVCKAITQLPLVADSYRTSKHRNTCVAVR